ncbi:MAG: DUF2147 domain-containing protein [Pseudomonadota bacterium]
MTKPQLNYIALLLNEGVMVFRGLGCWVVLGLYFAGSAMAGELAGIAGEWRTVRHGADVAISDCGDGTPCGFLLSVSADMTGGETKDVRNKNPELRDRPLIGVPILWGFSESEQGWRQGQLYNPDTGQIFRSSLELLSPDQLKVKGCLGPFCRQQIWTRLRSLSTEEQPDQTDE